MTKNELKYIKKYIDTEVGKVQNGTTVAILPTSPNGGDYTLRSYGLPIITKKSEHFTPSDGKHYRIQGSTLIGGDKILLAWTCDADGVNALLEERKLSNGELIRSKELKLGHANCLSYDTKRKVVYCCKYTSGLGSNKAFTHDVTILNYSNLTITSSIDISKYSAISNVGVAGCCYDAITDRLVLSTVNSSTESTRKREVIVLEAGTKNMVHRFNLFPTNTFESIGSATFQGIQMAHNGYCYTVDATNKLIQVLDYTKMTAIAAISINDWDDMWRPVLELEAMAPKDPTNPMSDIMIFHGGVVTSGAWYTNSMCGWINPFIGKKHRHRHAYLQNFSDGTNDNVGIVDPNYDGTSMLQNGITVPYIDPNMMLVMLSNKPARILWNDITFKAGEYGVLRSDHIECRINCEENVNISSLNLHYSNVHMKGANLTRLLGYSSKIWTENCACSNGQMYSSELKVIGGSGKYYGNNSSFGETYSNSTATLNNEFIN